MIGSSLSGDGPHRHIPDVDAPDDSLELLGEQDQVLVQIFDGWDATTSGPEADIRTVLRSNFDQGTYGKLLIGHTAVRVAAKTDIARVLRHVGCDGLADELTRRLPEARRLLDRLDELARGVDAMGVAASVGFAGAVGELAALIRADLSSEPEGIVPSIVSALGEHRGELHSSRWVHHHAPTHPGSGDRWYDRIPVLVRVHARYDHLRGFPWAHSSPMDDPSPSGPDDAGDPADEGR
jgi:hypothetical protein